MKSKTLQLILGVIIVIAYNLLAIAGVYYITAWIFGTVPFGNTEKEYGFFHGILHGMQCTFNFISLLFSDDVSFYAKHNTGFFYWVGYTFGLLGVAGPSTGMILNS
jgi:hypothetical protein